VVGQIIPFILLILAAALIWLPPTVSVDRYPDPAAALRAIDRRWRMRRVGCGLLALGAFLFWAGAVVAGVPSQATAQQRTLTRIVQQEWGLDGNVALHAAQIHQESAWRADVVSHAGAEGLAQFMPTTSQWMAEMWADLRNPDPYSTAWAMRAMVRYNRWHWSKIRARDPCETTAMMLSCYNGGLGWLWRDQRLTTSAGGDPQRWWGHVEHHTRRADWARRENRDYVRRIMHRLTPMYVQAGWPGEALCL